MTSTALGISKVFILDKYFTELQKFWDTEKKLQDATSTGEAVNLQHRLRSLSTGLVGLRNVLHEQQYLDEGAASNQGHMNGNASNFPSSPVDGNTTSSMFFNSQSQPNFNSMHEVVEGRLQGGFLQDGASTMRSVRSHVTEVSSVLTANISDPASSGGDGFHGHQVMPPAQPVSTLQHNYSNIQQPSPVLAGAVSDNQIFRHKFGGGSQRPSGPNSLNNFSLHSLPPVVTHTQSQQSMATEFPSKAEQGAFSKRAVRPLTPSEDFRSQHPQTHHQRRRERLPHPDEARRGKLGDLNDLIHLEPPMNEDSVIRALQGRFFNQKYFTNIGPIVLSVNPYRDVGNPLTLASTKNATSGDSGKALERVVQEAVRLQSESGYPQAIIVSGASGSGKTHASMVLLRQLFEVASGGGAGHETDTFKHLSASFTVLRSLGSAKTAANRESSRIGNFIEVQVSDGALYRTKIHCYFLDQGRVVRPAPTEKSYHIFYQMLAGLSPSERSQLGLEGFTVRDLYYLNVGDTRQDEVADAQRFADWKASLSVLGIPFMDVIRVFAAILLLGNVEFVPGCGDECYDIEVVGKEELNSVANLLGIETARLGEGLTCRTHTVRGQLVKSLSDANLCNSTRNALAKALYCRTVATIVRRANSLKSSGTMSSDSNESVHHEVASHHASTVGTAGSRKSSKSMAILNNAVRHVTDGFIGILDMFGFEDGKPSQLEQLCINLCSETMQHFYNTHIFKSSIESCREEGISSDVIIDYVDNVPCIDLISSLRTGLLSMLDVECSVRGFPETYVQKVKVQHKDNRKLFEPKHCDISRTFGIIHFAGQVIYDTSDFLDTNRDVIPDDVVSVFGRESCNFGFASHLFGNEIKALLQHPSGTPRGISFRISPTSTASNPENQLLNGDEPVSTLTQDFHTRLDNLLRTLVHAKPHFVRCIRPNEHDSLVEFDRSHVAQQIRSLQILETVNLMARGFPHRMRFKAFNARYRMLANPITRLSRAEEKAVEDCEIILDCYSRSVKEQDSTVYQNTTNNKDWAHGRKHVFLSEGARQQLENMRELRRQSASRMIQKAWRRWHSKRTSLEIPRHQAVSHQALFGASNTMKMSGQRPRPQPISGTPPPCNDPLMVDKCDFKTIQQTCSLFGLDLERPPPVPPSRPYTVIGGKKVTFPQTRVMKTSFSDDVGSGEILLQKGESVVVIGSSSKRGHLIVEKRNHTIHIPFHCLELKQNVVGPGSC